jgi:Fasciclin domain
MLNELGTQSNLTLLLPTEAAMKQLPADFTTELLNNKVNPSQNEVKRS